MFIDWVFLRLFFFYDFDFITRPPPNKAILMEPKLVLHKIQYFVYTILPWGWGWGGSLV